jgi:hypothetical protein
MSDRLMLVWAGGGLMNSLVLRVVWCVAARFLSSPCRLFAGDAPYGIDGIHNSWHYSDRTYLRYLGEKRFPRISQVAQ